MKKGEKMQKDKNRHIGAHRTDIYRNIRFPVSEVTA